MMKIYFKIDLRLLIPFLMPIFIFLIARLLYFIVGMEWVITLSGFAGIVIVSTMVSFFVSIFMFADNVEIGFIEIGVNKDDKNNSRE